MLEKFIDIMFGAGWILNSALFVPQILLLLQKKHANDVSLVTFIGFWLVEFFTVLHGYYSGDTILMVGVGLSLITCGITTLLIVYYRLKGSHPNVPHHTV